MTGRRGRGARLSLASSLTLLGLLGAAIAPPVAGAAGPGGAAAGSDDTVQVIVTYRGLSARATSLAADRAADAIRGRVTDRYRFIDAVAMRIPRSQLAALSRQPGVASVEIDAQLTAFDHGANTGDLEYENAWGVEHIGAPAVHAAGINGSGVKVAVIDTGIDYIHDDPDNSPYVVDPEFNGIYAGGYDFFNNDPDPYDDNGHGTHVSGILAAKKNGYLVSGVAPGVQLFALKVLGADGSGEYSGLIAALQWVIDYNATNADDIRVINMSLGGHEASPALQAAVEAAAASGILLVAASGNAVTLQDLLSGCAVAYPAAYPQVLSTTFTNTNNALTGFSCTGPEVDFAAPGNAIISPVPVGSCMFCKPQGYASMSGTSMASPHLAGTVALLLDAGIGDSGAAGLLDDVRGALCTTADTGFGVNSTPIPTTDPRYPKYFGCGVINADGAVFGLEPPAGAPVATDDVATVTEDGSTDIDVLANDTDAESDPLTVTSVTEPAHGTASINVDGTVHYAPDADYSGTDSFDYTVSDGSANDTGTVAVTVSPVNDDPVAVDDDLEATADTAAIVPVLDNDTDVDGDPLQVIAATTPANGSTVVADGAVTYTPSPGYLGPDAFDYTVSDGAGGTASAHVSLTVIPFNHAPVATGDMLSTPENTPATVDVLANDSDPDGDALSTTDVSTPTHGSAVIEPDGSVTYTPPAGYSGPDAFSYTVADSHGATDVGLVLVTVTAVNDPPVAANDSATTAEDTARTIDVAANDSDADGDSLSVVAIGQPAHGSAIAGSAGSIVYTPDANWFGADSFGYTISDGNGGSADATVSVSVTSVNDAPTSSDGTGSTKYQTPVAIYLAGGDVEKCNITFQIVTAPTNGTVNNPGSQACAGSGPYTDTAKVTYTPAADFVGTDSFTFRTSDGSVFSPTSTVTVSVGPPVLMRVADLDGTKTAQITTWTAKVTILVEDADGNPVSGVTVSGAWSLGATGTSTCKTSAAGTCTLSKSSIPKTTPSATFTVTGLSLLAGEYVGSENHDPDGDSDGTTILVNRL